MGVLIYVLDRQRPIPKVLTFLLCIFTMIVLLLLYLHVLVFEQDPLPDEEELLGRRASEVARTRRSCTTRKLKTCTKFCVALVDTTNSLPASVLWTTIHWIIA
ncbi:hypothetical protein NA56DRAFT_700699 [Hyaloscypha hepaticicola]|uniref:Uncharacterized protein n=1 Tax=Hyaloscypha hepaticicola TaxID=2082293 RepID=A0A2J6QD86_9HELO|nr:hypothetical protein NA56DRAFT_700699 [Hyaloscypha hepaticicola]